MVVTNLSGGGFGQDEELEIGRIGYCLESAITGIRKWVARGGHEVK